MVYLGTWLEAININMNSARPIGKIAGQGSRCIGSHNQNLLDKAERLVILLPLAPYHDYSTIYPKIIQNPCLVIKRLYYLTTRLSPAQQGLFTWIFCLYSGDLGPQALNKQNLPRIGLENRAVIWDNLHCLFA